MENISTASIAEASKGGEGSLEEFLRHVEKLFYRKCGHNVCWIIRMCMEPRPIFLRDV